MARPDIIVIGASAGGVEALSKLVSDLPAALPASIFVAVHIPATHKSLLPEILSRHGLLPASHALDGETIKPGHIYIAPPDYHLLVDKEVMHLSHGVKENHARPAIDPMFRSAAEAYGPRVISIVLSGALYDGTAGMIVVKRYGGIAIVQEPGDASVPTMPQSAINQDHPDYILPVSKIAAVLVQLTVGSPTAQKPKGESHAQ